jgi:hypothetical protein
MRRALDFDRNNVAVFDANDDQFFSNNETGSVASLWGHQDFYPERTIIPDNDSEWSTQLRERLNELTSLQVGWDGYRGVPVRFDCARFALTILNALYNKRVPAPNLVPGIDGTMQIEWHCRGFDVELDVIDVGQVEAYRMDIENNKEEELNLEVDFTKISNWIEEMAARS